MTMLIVIYLMCRPSKRLAITMEAENFTFDGPRITTVAIFGATALA